MKRYSGKTLWYVPSAKPFMTVAGKAYVGSTAGEKSEKYVRSCSERWN
jgi:hypothetical protein